MGLTGVGLAFFDMFGRADEDVLNFSNGVLSGATAMYFRKHAPARLVRNGRGRSQRGLFV